MRRMKVWGCRQACSVLTACALLMCATIAVGAQRADRPPARVAVALLQTCDGGMARCTVTGRAQLEGDHGREIRNTTRLVCFHERIKVLSDSTIVDFGAGTRSTIRAATDWVDIFPPLGSL